MVASTAAALKSFSVPGSGPTMSSAGNLESGFEFFRSMCSSYSSNFASTSSSAMATSLARSSAHSVSSPKGFTVKRLLSI
ncbi:hypothetical protein PI126_g15833 [Phytophthora idaei]|nr:hypothetical protein PI126_g15833 [Phytophthora idaei]